MNKGKRLYRFVILLAILPILTGGTANVAYYAPEVSVIYEPDKVFALYGLGIIEGSLDGFELERVPSKSEGVFMLLRLTGQEKNVEKRNNIGYNCIRYVCENGLVTEWDMETLDPLSALDAFDYIVFMLRLLGYNSDEEEESKLRAIDKAQNIGLITKSERLLIETTEFSRKMMMNISYNALKTDMWDQDVTLGEKLVSDGICDRNDALIYNIISEHRRTNEDKKFLDKISASELKPLKDRLENESYFIYNKQNCEEMKEMMDDISTPYAIVNKSHVLPKNHIPSLVSASGLPADVKNIKLQDVAYLRAKELFGEIKEKKIKLYVCSGFRNFGEQLMLYGNGGNAYVAQPGVSEHQTGLALDVVGPQKSLNIKYANTVEAKWLKDNSYRFGFIIRYPEGMQHITGYPSEWWHIRYVGKAIAGELHKRGSTLEEFYNVISTN